MKFCLEKFICYRYKTDIDGRWIQIHNTKTHKMYNATTKYLRNSTRLHAHKYLKFIYVIIYEISNHH